MKMKLNFRAALISAAFLGGSIMPGAVYSFSGPLLKANGVSGEADAIKYYETIDPGSQRLTQEKWRDVNGFNDSSNEIVVVEGHKNTSDLGFWRRIEMVIDKREGYKGNVAMTTYNFELGPNANLTLPANIGKTKCCLPGDAASIVNMEFSPVSPGGKPITKFYIYHSEGEGEPVADNRGKRKYSTFFDPDKAKREELFVPNACSSCHGGGKDFRALGGNTGGGFLAFDFNVFKYEGDKSVQDAARLANEPNVKELNKGVLKTKPPSAVKSLVSGLYGGKTLPSATQNSDYRPSDWDTEPALWNVVVTDCQGCHTLSESEVLSLDYWKSNVGDFREEIFKRKVMPNSPVANRRFFDTSNHHEIVKDALVRFRQ